jgi:hypothetical protein
VEGSFDKRLLEWFINEAGYRNVAVYEIDTIQIDARDSNEGGSRSRVLALSNFLNDRLGRDVLCFTGVIDADLDYALGVEQNDSAVLVTDYTSMELYAFSESCLRKFLALGLGVDSADTNELLKTYHAILHEVFLIRAAIRLTGMSLFWLDFTGCCSIEGESIRFDRDEFVTRLLMKNDALSLRGDLDTAIAALRSTLTSLDRRRVIHGHDFMDLVSLHWRDAARRRAFRQLSSISTILILTLEFSLVRQEQLFIRLVQRLGS